MKDVDVEQSFLSFCYNECATYLASLNLAFRAILLVVTLSETISH